MARSGSVSLIGRDDELARLGAWVRELRTGRGNAVLVEGESGIGKSMLVRTACADTEFPVFPVFWGSGDELGQDLPLLPLLDALRAHSVRDGETAADTRRDTIARLLRGEVTL